MLIVFYSVTSVLSEKHPYDNSRTLMENNKNNVMNTIKKLMFTKRQTNSLEYCFDILGRCECTFLLNIHLFKF